LAGRGASAAPRGLGVVRSGGELEWCRASGLAQGKRQQACAVQGLRLLVWTEGTLYGVLCYCGGDWGGCEWFAGPTSVGGGPSGCGFVVMKEGATRALTNAAKYIRFNV
jgi:hypothetical protein